MSQYFTQLVSSYPRLMSLNKQLEPFDYQLVVFIITVLDFFDPILIFSHFHAMTHIVSFTTMHVKVYHDHIKHHKKNHLLCLNIIEV